MVLVLGAGAIRLTEGEVGKDFANARDVGEHPVKHPPLTLILIEPGGGVVA